MQFAVTLLPLLAFASATPLVARAADLSSQVQNNLTVVQTDIKTLNNSVNAQAPGATAYTTPQLIAIVNANNALANGVNSTAATANASAVWTQTESTNIYNTVVNTIKPQVFSLLDNLNAHYPNFKTQGVAGVVHSSLATQRELTRELGSALTAKSVSVVRRRGCRMHADPSRRLTRPRPTRRPRSRPSWPSSTPSSRRTPRREVVRRGGGEAGPSECGRAFTLSCGMDRKMHFCHEHLCCVLVSCDLCCASVLVRFAASLRYLCLARSLLRLRLASSLLHSRSLERAIHTPAPPHISSINRNRPLTLSKHRPSRFAPHSPSRASASSTANPTPHSLSPGSHTTSRRAPVPSSTPRHSSSPANLYQLPSSTTSSRLAAHRPSTHGSTCLPSATASPAV